MLLYQRSIRLLNKDKIATLSQRALRQPPGIDGMGIHDDGAVILLADTSVPFMN